VAIALLLARLIGFGILAHGAQKLFGWFGGSGLAGSARTMEGFGFYPGLLFGLASGSCEFAGGVLILLGLGGPLGPMLVITTMVVATVAVRLRNGFFSQSNGCELPVTYIVIALLFAFTGYGRYSLDDALGFAAATQPTLAWGAVVLGALAGVAVTFLRGKREA
jgi:putative oxidoreductase